MISFKQSLIAAGYQVGILSTTSAPDVKLINNSFPGVFKWSHESLMELSYLTHNLKPDLAAYQRFVGRAEKIIYIEDKADYLEPVLELGWQAIHLVAFPDPDEELKTVPNSKNQYRALNHVNYRRAETLDQAFHIFTELGLVSPES
jgi:FMN phosphatase YigB (HAD superfamily)